MTKPVETKEFVPAQGNAVVMAGFETAQGFDLLQRLGKVFSSSNIVPKDYSGNLPNCIIAVDMATRMGANPLMVMQNLYVVHGRPAWSAQFLIATLNKSGKFSALRYEFEGEIGTDDRGCRAVATELATGEVLKGTLITIGLAKKEGWYNKNGSKWQTMPELMLQYRAASWFVRAYCPEIAMGLHTKEEIFDSTDIEMSPDATGAFVMEGADIDTASKPTKGMAALGAALDKATPDTEYATLDPDAWPEPGTAEYAGAGFLERIWE